MRWFLYISPLNGYYDCESEEEMSLTIWELQDLGLSDEEMWLCEGIEKN